MNSERPAPGEWKRGRDSLVPRLSDSDAESPMAIIRMGQAAHAASCEATSDHQALPARGAEPNMTSVMTAAPHTVTG